MSMITKQCRQCNKAFECDNREHNRGNGHFCSLSCSASYSNKNKMTHNLICRHCGNNYTSVNGTSIYCSYLCKSRSNYQKRKSTNRSMSIKALLNIKRCEVCGWNESTTDLHHIIPISKGGLDDLTNLIALCPNHHRMADRNLISQDNLQKIVNLRTISSSSIEESEAVGSP